MCKTLRKLVLLMEGTAVLLQDGWGVSTYQPLEQHPAGSPVADCPLLVSNQSVCSDAGGQPTHACTHNVVADGIIAMSDKLDSARSTFNILQHGLHQKRTHSLLVPGSARVRYECLLLSSPLPR